MAGNDDGDRVSSIGCADGTGCRWIADLDCKLGVASGFSEGDSEQGFPDIFLKPRPLHVERDGEALSLAGEVLPELALSSKEYGMLLVSLRFGQPHATRTVVLPKKGDEALIACEQLQISDRGFDFLPDEAHYGNFRGMHRIFSPEVRALW